MKAAMMAELQVDSRSEILTAAEVQVNLKTVKAADVVAIPEYPEDFNFWVVIMMALLETFFMGGAVGCTLGGLAV